MKLANLKKYLSLYNQEDYLFNFIGPQIRKRGFMKFDEFYKIGMWKSFRPKQKYLKNQNMIEEITKEAFREKDERKKVEKICSLKGVGVPTASAILTIVFPDKYAIIDIRCIEMLERLKFSIKNAMTFKNWVKYLEIIRGLAIDNNITPREVDKVLFAMHKELLDLENHRNLYKS